MRLSRYVVASDGFVEGGVTDRRVVMSTRRSAPVVVSERLWHALADGDLDDVPAEILAGLAERGVLVPDDANELAEVVDENRAAIESDRTLHHVVQPTAGCQLGCGYCGQEHTARLLSVQDQDRLVARLDAMLDGGGYDRLSIGWFGAEPLLGMRVMRRLTPLLRAMSEARGIDYSAKVVTNGVTLDRALARELEALGVVEVEITLDGVGEVHDRRRPTKSGGGSFDRIAANLSALASDPGCGLGITVRCNVDRHNADGVADLMQWLADAQLQRRIAFYTSPVYSWGNDADADALSLEDYADREVEWLAMQHALGFQVGLLPRRREIVCLAVRRDGELTDAYANVFSCTEVSYVPAYGEPNRYAVGGLTIRRRRDVPFRTFNDDLVTEAASPCAQCWFLPACGGSCPKLWSEGRVPCPSMKANLSQRLLLWYATARTEVTA